MLLPNRFLLMSILACLALPLAMAHGTVAAEPTPERDALAVVRGYADAMLEHGRDHFGPMKTPLFAIVLDRQSYEIPTEPRLATLVTARVPQEFRFTANPQMDLNLYQTLHGLTAVTGDSKYAAGADETLRYFLLHCKEPRFGFFTWGEHLGWDLVRETMGGYPDDNAVGAAIHEFQRPWIYWDSSFVMAPAECHRFAKALWDHQIDRQGTVSFSRHAMVGKGEKASRRQREFPRHGGFYIATWAAAWQHTQDPVMLEAIEGLLGYFESVQHPDSRAIPAYTIHPNMLWPVSTLSLAIDLCDAAERVPEPLATRMRKLAAEIDTVFLALPHSPGPGGKGFVFTARVDTLEPSDFWHHDIKDESGEPEWLAYTGGWRTAYNGQQPHGPTAGTCIVRYNQTHNPEYRRLILACADGFLDTEPDLEPTPGKDGRMVPADAEAGAVGQVIQLLAAAYRITDDPKYLERAEWFSQYAISHFWPDDLPLPQASIRQNVYAATSRCDTLAAAMLETWVLRHKPELDVSLVPTDR